MTITGRNNSVLRQAREVRDGKHRDLIFIEGIRLCEEAVNSDLSIKSVIYSPDVLKNERAASLIETLRDRNELVTETTTELLTTISDTKTPQGLIILAPRPSSKREEVAAHNRSRRFLVIIHGLNNPVNVGAILRSAEAAGVTGVVVTFNTADPFSPKALRGAMGSAFRLPIWTNVEYQEVLAWCAAEDIKTICAMPDAELSYTEMDWRMPAALIVGPEATGLAPEEVALANQAVRIPMLGEVESLNVAAAAAIVLFEAARQRAV